MAMVPFCGYNMADYWGHWLEMGRRMSNPPKIFRLNWFRTAENGKFLWPGFGENLRVLKWVLDRCQGHADAEETAIGWVPTMGSIDREGLDVSDDAMRQLLRVDRLEWIEAVHGQHEYFEKFGDHVPQGMWDEHEALARRVIASH
jgi:phosphoenolpyruvate carboxykinase (GTP)